MASVREIESYLGKMVVVVCELRGNCRTLLDKDERHIRANLI